MAERNILKRSLWMSLLYALTEAHCTDQRFLYHPTHREQFRKASWYYLACRKRVVMLVLSFRRVFPFFLSYTYKQKKTPLRYFFLIFNCFLRSDYTDPSSFLSPGQLLSLTSVLCILCSLLTIWKRNNLLDLFVVFMGDFDPLNEASLI